MRECAWEGEDEPLDANPSTSSLLFCSSVTSGQWAVWGRHDPSPSRRHDTDKWGRVVFAYGPRSKLKHDLISF